MKRILSLLLAVTIILACTPVIPMQAEAATSGNYTYTVSGGEATITDCKTTISGDITIPSSLGGYPVTAIGNEAFYKCRNMTSVVIPEGVTTIGSAAFRECYGITNIEIPDSVTSISDGAFRDCGSLTSVEIPEGITVISEYTFYQCYRLSDVIIPNSVTTISASAFAFCMGLPDIHIPDSVTSIGYEAFRGCNALTSVVIPGNVTTLGNGAFYGCGGLESVVVSYGLTEIPVLGFSSCINLKRITLPDSIVRIGSNAFQCCEALTDIVLPDSLTEIGSSAFASCYALTGISIPDGIVTIPDFAFEYCNKLKTVAIPNSVAMIGYQAFYDCYNLHDVYFRGTQEDWDAIAIGADNRYLIGANRHYNACGDALSWKVTGSTLTISGSGDMYDFSGNSAPWYDLRHSIYHIVLEEGITGIGYSAFKDFYCLQSIDIPQGVTKIGGSAFYNCTNLRNISIPDSITEIEYSPFYNCINLQYTIYDNGKYLGNTENPYLVLAGLASYNGNCYQIHNTTKVIFPGVFGRCDSLSQIVIPEGITHIRHDTFSECWILEEITIPESVTAIGNNAFSHCYCLTTVYYQGTRDQMKDIVIASGNEDLVNATWVCAGEEPEYNYITGGTCGDHVKWTLDAEGTLTVDGWSNMGELADQSTPWYDYQDSIRRIVVADGVSSIADYAFRACYNLTEVILPYSVTYIGDAAFDDCTSLKNIDLSKGITYIGDAAFRYCSSLTKINISADVRYIGADSFQDCFGLQGIWVDEDNACYSSDVSGVLFNKAQTELLMAPIRLSGSYTVPAGVTKICAGAFSNCFWLEEITICPGVIEIGDSAFMNAGIKRVMIPDTVTAIADYAFSCCNDLQEVTISASVTDIGHNAFEYCDNLETVYYYGNAAQKEQMRIDFGNESLTAANWIYKQPPVCEYRETGNSAATRFETLESALTAATTGTIRLLANVTTDILVLRPGMTLDLNGYVLTANLVVVMNGAGITDGDTCTGGGSLKIERDNLALAKDAGDAIPVWNGVDGYVFTKVTFQQLANPGETGASQYIFLPSFSNAEASALMADGGLDNGIKIKVCLTWNNGQSQQFYTYNDSLVQKVFDGTGKWVFDLKVSGIGSIADITASPMVVSDSGGQAAAQGIPLK